MSLQTPTTIRARQWKLLSQGEDTLRAGVSSRDTSIERPTIEGLAVKPIGKPSAGNRHARFDERGWETERWPLAPSYRAHPRLYRGWLGLALYTLKRYDEALLPLREYASRAPNMRSAHIWLAATYAQLGRLNEATAEAAEVLRIDPAYTIGGTARRLSAFKRPQDAEQLFNGLRTAGLPE